MSKVILITGSNKGIGFEIARECGKAGFHVIISGRNEERLNTALERLLKENINADSLLMDVSSRESIEKAAKQFSSKNLKIDVLVNNAGIIVKGDNRLLQNDKNLLEQTIITNSYGPLYVTKSFLPFIYSPGRIIMVSSTGGALSRDVMEWSPAYCVSKTLLNAITLQLAYELRDKNISVNAVCPGWVRTDMGGATAPRSVEKGAETPVWLATEAAQKLTGNFLYDKTEISW
ncbi:MAG: SDR family NAD(P)-dependent oxidoreductase [Chitinophagaceae bacterium]|nr:SDR family NAD(P)-dependent oxidoreductase [Chitinophagaceae bacterium]